MISVEHYFDGVDIDLIECILGLQQFASRSLMIAVKMSIKSSQRLRCSVGIMIITLPGIRRLHLITAQ